MVDWINTNFARAFPAVDDVTQSAIHYRPFLATKLDIADAGVVIHPVIKQASEGNDEASQCEAELIIQVIQNEHRHHANQKIAVLVRSKKHLANLVSQLRRNHPEIAFQAVEIEALEGRQIVQDLLSLTHALHHRADRVHWLAILRAPWCGLSLHDLHVLAGRDLHSTVWSLMQNEDVTNQLSADGQARLQHVREIFSEAFATQGCMNISRWVRGVWLTLNGTACLWEKSDVIDVQAFFACLDNLDRSNQFSPERMAIEITKLFATPDTHGEQLQMMTIHKSKGLEFDTVILPGLGASTGGNNSDKPLVLWEEVTIEDETQLLAAPYIPKGLRKQASVSPYDYLEDLENTREKNEAARVLYVAATRAMRKLHLVGIANQNAKGEIKPTANTYLDLLWPIASPVFDAALVAQASHKEVLHNNDIVSQDTIANFTPRLARLTNIQIPDILQQSHLSSRQVATHPGNQATQKLSLNNPIEADLGTLTHKYLELIAHQGLTDWPVTRVALLKPAMQRWLQQQGHQEKVAAIAAVSVVQLLITTLSSKAGQWVLKARAQADQELSISLAEASAITSYVVDRTFIEQTGDGKKVRWIIDYKSVALESQLSDSALKTIAEQYKAQLESYAQLFKADNLPIQKAIFFVSLGRLVEIN